MLTWPNWLGLRVAVGGEALVAVETKLAGFTGRWLGPQVPALAGALARDLTLRPLR